MSGLSLTADRTNEFLYFYPFYFGSASFTTPSPRRVGYSATLLGPFEDIIWIFLLIFFKFSIILSIILTKYRDVTQIRWTIISIIFGQSIDSFTSRLSSLRCLICVWLLGVFVLRIYYCGDLFGLLSVTEWDRIETIDEFANALRTGRLKILSTPAKHSYIMPIKVFCAIHYQVKFIYINSHIGS